MRKLLVILGVVAVVFAANLSANALSLARTDDAGKAVGQQVLVPPILSQAGPKVPVMARAETPAPTKITPVVKGPGEKFSPTPEDWATYMHDSSHTCMIDGNAGGVPAAAWTYVTPGGGQTAFAGSPVESDGIICFTSSDGYLYAINRNTGTPAWAAVLEGAANYRGGTPVIFQDRVVSEMVTGTGTTSSVFCNSMADGSSLWTTPIPPTPNVWNIYLSRPIVLSVSGAPYVFLGCGDFTATATRVLGLNMLTGAIAYDTTISGNVIIGGLATDGSVLFVPLQTTGVVALQPAIAPHFTFLWAQNPAPTATVNSTPVYFNGQVFAAQGAITGPVSLYALDVSSGAVNWSKQVGDGTMGLDLGSPAVEGGMVYMFASNFSTSPYSTQIMAYHQSDGSDAWGTWYTTTDGLFDGGLAVTTGTNKRLYLTTGFGSTSLGHLITLDAGSGSLIQDLPYATDYLYNSICRPYGGLYTLTYGSSASGTLVAYTVNDGQPAGADVGFTAITAPGLGFTPGAPVAPAGVVTNFGTNSQSNVPVTCYIDSLGTNVYTATATVAGPITPGGTGIATFSPNWTPGNAASYSVKMFTTLSGDTTLSNDTARLNTYQSWTRFTPCPDSTDRIVHATVYDPVDDQFYMIGGNPAGNTGTYLALNRMYDPTGDVWVSLAPLPTALGWEPGAYCREHIYYLGGHNNSSAVVTTNYIYDINADAWSTGTAVPRGRLADMEVTWRDTLIYCIGGWDGASSSGLTTVDIYDPSNDAWLSGTALPTDMDMGGAAIIGDTIYIVNAVNRSAGGALGYLYKGGIDPSDPTSINWIQGPAFGSNATCITGAAALGGKVYWFGGFVGATTPSNAGWCYDPATGAITSTINYMGTIARNQWLCARTIQGPNSGLYGFAGDSACNWAAPNRGYYKLTIPTVVTGVAEHTPVKTIVATGILSAPTPNPFNGRTVVNYSLSQPGNVSLKLYDIAGHLVRVITSGSVPAGSHTATIDASKLAHGIYLLKLETAKKTSIAKLIRD